MTIYEILASAPSVRTSAVTLEKLIQDWETLKGYKITKSGNTILIDSHVMATLISGSSIRFNLLSSVDVAEFDALVQRARTKLNENSAINPKIKAMHDGCRTLAGDY